MIAIHSSGPSVPAGTPWAWLRSGPPSLRKRASDLTHMLVTEVLPRGGFVGNNARGSVSNDANTPLNPDGTPILEDAWRYLMTARDGREDIAQRDEE